MTPHRLTTHQCCLYAKDGALLLRTWHIGASSAETEVKMALRRKDVSHVDVLDVATNITTRRERDT